MVGLVCMNGTREGFGLVKPALRMKWKGGRLVLGRMRILLGVSVQSWRGWFGVFCDGNFRSQILAQMDDGEGDGDERERWGRCYVDLWGFAPLGFAPNAFHRKNTTKKLHSSIEIFLHANCAPKSLQRFIQAKEVTLTNLGCWKYINNQILQLKQNHNK